MSFYILNDLVHAAILWSFLAVISRIGYVRFFWTLSSIVLKLLVSLTLNEFVICEPTFLGPYLSHHDKTNRTVGIMFVKLDHWTSHVYIKSSSFKFAFTVLCLISVRNYKLNAGTQNLDRVIVTKINNKILQFKGRFKPVILKWFAYICSRLYL